MMRHKSFLRVASILIAACSVHQFAWASLIDVTLTGNFIAGVTSVAIDVPDALGNKFVQL